VFSVSQLPKMRSLVLVLLVGVVGSQACKYFCKAPDGYSYTCCDDSAEDTDDEATKSTTKSSTTSVNPPTRGCYYYCAYDGDVYCCADNTRPIPASHAAHPGRCPEETDQVCKNSGIYLLTKKAKVGKTSGALQLASEEGKALDSCASDGYCEEEEKCCPSKCGRKHVCLKSINDKNEEEKDD